MRVEATGCGRRLVVQQAGKGGHRGVQLRAGGPEGVLPPWASESVLEQGAELARAGDEGDSLPASPDVCALTWCFYPFISAVSHALP